MRRSVARRSASSVVARRSAKRVDGSSVGDGDSVRATSGSATARFRRCPCRNGWPFRPQPRRLARLSRCRLALRTCRDGLLAPDAVAFFTRQAIRLGHSLLLRLFRAPFDFRPPLRLGDSLHLCDSRFLGHARRLPYALYLERRLDRGETLGVGRLPPPPRRLVPRLSGSPARRTPRYRSRRRRDRARRWRVRLRPDALRRRASRHRRADGGTVRRASSRSTESSP